MLVLSDLHTKGLWKYCSGKSVHMRSGKCSIYFGASPPRLIDICTSHINWFLSFPQATALGLLGAGFPGAGRGRGTPPRGRGRGGMRGRGGGRQPTLSVDRRPKQLVVSGYTPEDKDNVLELLSVSTELVSA